MSPRTRKTSPGRAGHFRHCEGQTKVFGRNEVVRNASFVSLAALRYRAMTQYPKCESTLTMLVTNPIVPPIRWASGTRAGHNGFLEHGGSRNRESASAGNGTSQKVPARIGYGAIRSANDRNTPKQDISTVLGPMRWWRSPVKFSLSSAGSGGESNSALHAW